MKRSIRYNLFILFALLMVGFVVSGILLNALMLEKYYIYKNKAIFSGLAADIIQHNENNNSIQPYIENIDRENGISVTIADDQFIILHASYSKKKDINKVPKEIEDLILTAKLTQNQPMVYSKIDKNNVSQPKLAYAILTNKQEYIILTKSIKSIRESADIANQFYFYAGFIALVLGSFFMFRFSEKVTNPIVEISQIAKEISELKFGRKIKLYTHDELGVLATSINTLSDKLEQSICSLKNDIEFQRSLSRNISHELKTPIGIIKGYSEGLLFGIADNPEMSIKYLKIIVAECDQMDDLVNEMLVLSKLSSKDFHLTNQRNVNCKTLFDDAICRFDNVIQTEQIKLCVNCSENVIIYGNFELLYRVVLNLLSNAIKYSDENKRIDIKAFDNDHEVVLSVFNSCAPIAESELIKIFDEFYKVDKARTREKGGHGLGLTIVKSIVELHQGTIKVDNVFSGIEIVIRFPKKNDYFTSIS